jgi:phage-related protein
MSEKPIRWRGSSLADLRAFPDEARQRAGFELDKVQHGKMPSDFKPMPTVGTGVYEIRIRTEVAHRVFYIASFPEAVYVLHAFEKRTQQTSKADLSIGTVRLKELLRERTLTKKRT